jgi:exopolysaccharide production protein ExoQ
MPKASVHASELSGVRWSAPTFDKFTLVPFLACAYATTVAPLILFTFSSTAQEAYDSHPEHKVFWPAMTAIAFILAARNRRRLALPPHIICLFAYLAFAGASVVWAINPQLSFIRFAQQVMVVTTISLPLMLVGRTADMMRGLFICFAIAATLNLFFISGQPPYSGYFGGKNYLGEFAGVALLLALHEVLYSGFRRALGIIFVFVAIALLLLSDSKTSFGLAILAPLLAGLTLIVGRTTGLSPAIILLSIPIGYEVLSHLIPSFNFNRLSYILYGDPTFTGRTLIWDFADFQIWRRPLQGWGYQSFWLAGPESPSLQDARGWIRSMPNAHNGYVDTKLEMGYIGLAFLVTFILTALHAIKRVADRDPVRAWGVLSLALFVIIYNFLESTWMRAFEFLWVVFLIISADLCRYWRPFGLRARPRQGSRFSANPR